MNVGVSFHFGRYLYRGIVLFLILVTALSSLGVLFSHHAQAAPGDYTWRQDAIGDQIQWYAVASSADGTKLVGTTYGGYIYTSSDSGATWTERTTSG
jgi:hypothetical protein